MLPALLTTVVLLLLALALIDYVRPNSLIREMLRQDDERPPFERVLDRLRR